MDDHDEDVVEVDAPTYDEERAKWEQETQSLRELKKGQEALREIRRYRVRQFYKHQVMCLPIHACVSFGGCVLPQCSALSSAQDCLLPGT